jgi:hypothetical protein
MTLGTAAFEARLGENGLSVRDLDTATQLAAFRRISAAAA